MNAHQADAAGFEQGQSRSHYEWDENDWEYEGKYMELEKLLKEGGRQPLSRRQKLEQGRPAAVERESFYESVKGSRLQQKNRGYVLLDVPGKTKDHTDSQTGHAQGRATDWQDFEDYEPGYSGHQTSGQRARSVLPGKDFTKQGKRAMKKGAAKKTKDYARSKKHRRMIP